MLSVFLMLGLSACANHCPLQQRAQEEADAACPAMIERDLSEFAGGPRASD